MPAGRAAPMARRVAVTLACTLHRSVVITAAELKFSVLAPLETHGRCCPTPFFSSLMKTLESQPGFTEHPDKAQVVFVHLDTLRMCEWPNLRMLPDDGIGCTDGGGDPLEGINHVHNSCDWCCPQGTDLWLDTVKAAIEIIGKDQTYVFFKNAQDTRQRCHEFDYAKLKSAELGVQVRFVGFQLQKSQLAEPVNAEDPIAYPLEGVNLLVPLIDAHVEGLPEDDEKRTKCKDRAWLAYFNGMRSTGLRDAIFDLADAHPKVAIHENVKFGQQDPMGYQTMLQSSVFGLVPRGDEHFTFRLTEVLAAGGVPVVIDDDFYAPYAKDDLADWAVVIPESKVPKTIDILTKVDNKTICKMKKEGAKKWRYGRDMQAVVDGLLKGLSRLLDERRLLHEGHPVMEQKSEAVRRRRAEGTGAAWQARRQATAPALMVALTAAAALAAAALASRICRRAEGPPRPAAAAEGRGERPPGCQEYQEDCGSTSAGTRLLASGDN